jgi:hypothetical protein
VLLKRSRVMMMMMMMMREAGRSMASTSCYDVFMFIAWVESCGGQSLKFTSFKLEVGVGGCGEVGARFRSLGANQLLGPSARSPGKGLGMGMERDSTAERSTVHRLWAEAHYTNCG